jgi:LPS-assembly lipoprotein
MDFTLHNNLHASLRMLSLRTFVVIPVVLIVLLGIHACGFQLRGAISLSAEISPVYLQQNSAFDLAREIKNLLVSNDIDVVDNVSQSKSQLVLLNEVKSRRVLSVDGNGRAREYLLSYKVNFTMQTTTSDIPAAATKTETDSLPAVSQETISVTRTLLFDPDAVLAVTNEADILYKDMRREAARLILLKLQAKSNSATGSDTGKDTGNKSAGDDRQIPDSASEGNNR